MLGFEAEDGTKFGQNGSGTIEVLLPRHLYGVNYPIVPSRR